MRHIIVDGVVFDTAGDLAVKVRKLLETIPRPTELGRFMLFRALRTPASSLGSGAMPRTTVIASRD
jgi:hypothetical protein